MNKHSLLCFIFVLLGCSFLVSANETIQGEPPKKPVLRDDIVGSLAFYFNYFIYNTFCDGMAATNYGAYGSKTMKDMCLDAALKELNSAME